MTLTTRVQRIEAKLNAGEDIEPLLIHPIFVSPDPAKVIDNELRLITGAGGDWFRATGESAEEFTDRALRAAQKLQPGSAVVCIGFSK